MSVRVVGGRLLDTYGRAAVIVPTMFVQTIGAALLAGLGLGPPFIGGAAALPVLAIAGILSGGAHGYLYPGLAALVTDRAPPIRRAAVVGVFSAMFLVGQTGGAFLFGWIAQTEGYGIMWALLTAFMLFGALLSLRLPGAPTAPPPPA
jgi:MFS family permease